MKRINPLMILGTAGLILLFSCEIPPVIDTPDYIDPEARISITTPALPGLSGRYAPGNALGFDGAASTGGEQVISSWSWDFGDGTPETEGENASHAYAAAGNYTVILTVSDANGQIDEDRADIVINSPPEAILSTGDVSLPLGESVTLRSEGSEDPDGTLESYSWDLGDGTAGAGTAITYTYGAAGAYTAVLTVTDNDGTIDSDSVTVTVLPRPNVDPSADAGDDRSLAYDPENTLIAVDGSGSYDPDGALVSRVWSFASLPAGSTLTEADLNDAGDGTASFDISGESDAAMAEGSLTYELTLTVTDDRGGSDSDSVLISVTGTGTVIIGIE